MNQQLADPLSLLIEMDERLVDNNDGTFTVDAQFAYDWKSRVYPHRIKDMHEGIEQAEEMNRNMRLYGTIDAPDLRDENPDTGA